MTNPQTSTYPDRPLDADCPNRLSVSFAMACPADDVALYVSGFRSADTAEAIVSLQSPGGDVMLHGTEARLLALADAIRATVAVLYPRAEG
jgi:hypothetical protein